MDPRRFHFLSRCSQSLKINPHLFFFHRAPQHMLDEIITAQELSATHLIVDEFHNRIGKPDCYIDCHFPPRFLVLGLYSPVFDILLSADLPETLFLPSSTTDTCTFGLPLTLTLTFVLPDLTFLLYFVSSR